MKTCRESFHYRVCMCTKQLFSVVYLTAYPSKLAHNFRYMTE